LKGFQYEPKLVPDWDLVQDSKSGRISKEVFTAAYEEQLSKLSREEIFSKWNGYTMFCFEKEGFCHRHIFSKWMREGGYLVKEYGTFNVAVVGSRTINDGVKSFLEKLDKRIGIQTIISGGARGVDSEAEEFAKENFKETKIYLADWEKYGRSAGFIRNADIVKNADLIVAFWDGKSKGTQHSIELARKHNKPTIIKEY
jgi:hypothetical protein